MIDKRSTDPRFEMLAQKIDFHDEKLTNHITEFDRHIQREEAQDKLLVEAIDRLSTGHDKLVAIAEANKESWQVWFDIHTTTNRLRRFALWLGGFGLFAGFVTWCLVK
jgi:hypothetical protein